MKKSLWAALLVGLAVAGACTPLPPESTTTTTTTSTSSSTTTTSTTTTTLPPAAAYEVDPTFGSSGKLDLAATNGPSLLGTASDGGFFRSLGAVDNWRLERYTSAGTKVTGFAPPNYLRPTAFVGQRANGDVVLVGQVLHVFGTAAAVMLVDALGDDTSHLLSFSVQAGDIAPNGRFAAAGAGCTSSSCNLRVQQFAADATALASWTTPVSSGLGGYCSQPKVGMTEFDDGSAIVSVSRCAPGTPTAPIGVESVRFLATGELDASYGGGDGRATLTSTDDGTTTAPLRQVLHSDDGSVLVISMNGTARRLTSDGTADLGLGLVDLPGLLGGPLNGIVPDDSGYVAATAPLSGACGTGPATVVRIDATGTLDGAPTTLPWALDGAALNRYPDGRILVSGASRMASPNPDGTTSCVAPYTVHAARLLPS